MARQVSLSARALRPGPLAALALLYLVLVSAVMIWRGISVSPDYLLLLLVPVAVVSRRLLRFAADWVPFVAILLGWEAMRGIAPRTGIPPLISELAGADRWLGGGRLPTATLQQALAPLGEVVDDAATVVYFCHFLVPIGVGLVLWLVDRRIFLRFVTALMGLAFACFVVYLLVPTAPPWYAQDHGMACCFRRVIGTTLPSAVSPYYQSLNPNPVAAFPSLHAAFPMLALLALRALDRRLVWPALAWCLMVWVSIVYLGEHYLVDALAGIGSAALAWTVMTRLVAPRVGALREARVGAGG
ncbi:MAG TPA: phosphatase PAP2 family protein [Candidatus Dormibacteraeota bacterium]|jgi:membrane-associated phospholipid phosphatase